MTLLSGTKKEPKPKLLSPDIFSGGVGVFHVKEWGPKSSVCPSKAGFWLAPNPPGANPLVAERAFPTSDCLGRTVVARCAEEMTGICRDFQ